MADLFAKVALVLGILGGWALVTWGVADLTVPEVWPVSGGLFVLSLVGWKFLGTLFGRGLYVLSRSKAKGGYGCA